MTGKLAGTFVVVPLVGDRAAELALALSGEGAAVVLAAEPSGTTAAGRLAGEIQSQGGRVAVFASEGDASDTEALVELVAELRGAAGR